MDSAFESFMLDAWVENGLLTKAGKAAKNGVFALVVAAGIALPVASASNLNPFSGEAGSSKSLAFEVEFQTAANPAYARGLALTKIVHDNIHALSSDAVDDLDPELLAFARESLGKYRARTRG